MGDRLRPLWDFDDLDVESRAVPRAARRGDDRRWPGRGADAARARRESCGTSSSAATSCSTRRRRLGGVTARLLLERGRRERVRRGRTVPGSRSSSGRSSSRRRAGTTSSPSTRRTCSRSSTTPKDGRRAGSRSRVRPTIPVSGTGSRRCTTTSAGRVSRPATTWARSRRSSWRSPRASATTRASRALQHARDAVDEARRALAGEQA